MKQLSVTVAKGLVIGLLSVALLFVTGAWAKPTTPEQAKTVVANWLGLDAQPLGSALSQKIKEVKTFADDSGKPLYFVVYLNPTGLVLVSGEDLVEPIIGFLPTATSYDPATSNPLGALVSRDVPGRVQQARQLEAQAMATGSPLGAQTPQAAAQEKWALLEDPAALMGGDSGIANVSDLRVAPFVQTHWSQTTTNDAADGDACYNYYTFPYAPGSSDNYPCGCVATAMGQLMYYLWHSTTGVGTGWFTVTVDDVPIEASLRGGDGYGGVYNWNYMPLSPSSGGTTETQRQAIGNLLHDAGVAAKMQYTPDSSGAYLEDAAAALVNTFGYSNAIVGDNIDGSDWVTIPYANRNTIINSNLHAKYPVILGINGPPGGHAIVCDGYGYNTQSMYHHLNMGWSGQDDAWYNLPLIYPPEVEFNVLGSIIYNVYSTGSGEIIAGRVTDSIGRAVNGATVTATSGSTYTATTDANGIYALAKVPSKTTFNITVSKPGYTFLAQTVTTGKSTNGSLESSSYVCGNLWGVDFVSQSELGEALDNYKLVFTTSGPATWYGQTGYWYYGGSAARSGAIADNQSSVMQTTVVGPGVLTFYWACSCTPTYNKLMINLDASLVDWISGVVTWTQKTVTIPKGVHTVTWTYSKTANASGALGYDCGFVDKVVYEQQGVTPNLEPVYLLLLLQ